MLTQELLDLHSHPEMAKIETEMVYQVWDDGEITLQKCGSLLWQRTLHCLAMGFEYTDNECLWPEIMDNHGYIFTDEEGANAIRESLSEYLDHR